MIHEGVRRALPPAVYCAIKGGGSVARRGARALRPDGPMVECEWACALWGGMAAPVGLPDGSVWDRVCDVIEVGAVVVVAGARKR